VPCVVVEIVMTELRMAAFAVTFWLMAQPHCAFRPATLPQSLTVAATSTYALLVHLRHDTITISARRQGLTHTSPPLL
jgi:hypothetical protein